MATNCILWAYALQRRRRAKGKVCTVYWRRSLWGFFPHCLYAELRFGRMRLVSYKPLAPKRRLVPPPVFRGTSKWGDL